ncbi:hypothetical protein UFOVP1344_44 [uncultured Caudovirales phage]|uniref:Uncharacterized protein n=1 Tax=uncultured Caudovirales phage TaxID=2100421 RepID=A0A6J5Q2J3_9CAUD|nr:hypothetical protein UFOVP1005_44 [uncultured Caudovirales phage]CAB4200411.1 hypothetical protein UFOVP1344_44 [uncultured Caudovirales phage]CAB4218667.1 hypothetical protein UFOVP1602_44 [uncultured Caudovirales phage]
MAYRDNFYRPDEQKERDRRRAKEDASVRKAVARRRASRDKKVMTDADIQKKKDAIKKAQSLTPYSKIIRSKKTQRGIIARMKAKREGQAAAVRIAKARVAKKKKQPLTIDAIAKNMEANKLRKRNTGAKISNSHPGGTIYYDGTKNPAVIIRNERKSKYTAQDYKNIPMNDKKVKSLMAESKVSARKSGGYATSMKRNAEAGLSHIVRGRAMKGVARASGVLGIAALVAQHLGGEKDKKNG